MFDLPAYLNSLSAELRDLEAGNLLPASAFTDPDGIADLEGETAITGRFNFTKQAEGGQS